MKEIALSISKNRVDSAAKASIIGSSLFGMISGSVTANGVVSTGSVTIPLMRKRGQIMPPVIGASVFVMAELLGLPYK